MAIIWQSDQLINWLISMGTNSTSTGRLMRMLRPGGIVRRFLRTITTFLVKCRSLMIFQKVNNLKLLIKRSASSTYKQQISKVKGCGLRRIGTMDFDIGSHQTCTTARDTIYVCFGQARDRNECYASSAPLGKFSAIQKSSYGHYQTRLSASPGNFVFCLIHS